MSTPCTATVSNGSLPTVLANPGKLSSPIDITHSSSTSGMYAKSALCPVKALFIATPATSSWSARVSFVHFHGNQV